MYYTSTLPSFTSETLDHDVVSNFAVSVHCHRVTLPWLTVRIWYVAGSAPSLLERAMLYEILSNVPEENVADGLMVQCRFQFKTKASDNEPYYWTVCQKHQKHQTHQSTLEFVCYCY